MFKDTRSWVTSTVYRSPLQCKKWKVNRSRQPTMTGLRYARMSHSILEQAKKYIKFARLEKSQSVLDLVWRTALVTLLAKGHVGSAVSRTSNTRSRIWMGLSWGISITYFVIQLYYERTCLSAIKSWAPLLAPSSRRPRDMLAGGGGCHCSEDADVDPAKEWALTATGWKPVYSVACQFSRSSSTAPR